MRKKEINKFTDVGRFSDPICTQNFVKIGPAVSEEHREFYTLDIKKSCEQSPFSLTTQPVYHLPTPQCCYST